ncbi:MAG: 30S ribosomal protein S9 [Brevinematia bacterium]
MTKIYATGRRKTSVARVFLIPSGKGKILINGKDIEKYFPANYVNTVKEPLVITETLSKYDVYATVKGGGLTGQAEALRHGISRCIDQIDRERYHKILKSKGFLTRDPRMVQRKHFGLKKARKAPQYSKR